MDIRITCWNTAHIIYCGIFFIGFILFTIILILISFLNTKSRPYCIDALRRFDNNDEIYFVAYRILLTTISHYTA